jgi:tRNA pseudouridine38-40 synthase
VDQLDPENTPGRNMSRYFVKLSFDGTRYHGWQTQPNATTVQEVLNKAFSMMLRTPMKLTGCGRTDTGVHASEYYAHFDSEKSLDSEHLERLAFKLNGYLDDDIAIHSIFPVNPKIHSRFSAVSRTYRYVITTVKDPFLVNRAYYLYGKIEVDRMNEAATWLKHVDDFTSFSKVDTDTKTNICRVTHAEWTWEGECLVFTITADRFLRNMVRAIVGTLIDLGTGKTDMNEFRQITAGKNRSDAGDSVPASGLFLTAVVYPFQTD